MTRFRPGRRLALALTAGLGACSPVVLLNGLAPDRRVAEGLAYGPLPRQRLDVYSPAPLRGEYVPAPLRGEHVPAPLRGEHVPAPLRGDAPLVVFIHGGNWESGARDAYRFVGASLAARGAVAVVPDYRLYPAVRFPDFLRDCAAAVGWARRHAARFGADPARVFVMGHSAGAYNAAMLALDPQWLGAEGLVPGRDLAGAIGVSGPYDFLPLTSPMLRDLFGPELARTQPINFADGAGPPMLLLHGEADRVVLPGNATRLAARIRERGGRATLRLYPGIGHEVIIGAMAGVLRPLAPTLRDTLDFIGGIGSGGASAA